MRLLRRASAATVAAALILGAAIATPAIVSADDTADVRSFAATGEVALEDLQPSTPTKEGFTLVDAELPPQAEDARQPDGSVPIYVRLDTKYYLYDPDTQTSKASSYDELVQTGTQMKVGGQVATVGSQKQLVARWVWAPVPDGGTRVPNPQPSAPRDYTFQRTFNVVGSVTQTGARFPGWNGPYSEEFGFVAGLFTSYNNAHIAQVAGAHKGKLNLNVLPTTTYYLQGSDGKYRKVDKSQAITLSADVRVVGKYAWVGDDWRLLVTSVWQPMKSVARGAIDWFAALSSDGDGYDGTNLSGGDEVFPGTTQLEIDWTPQTSGPWLAEGTWTAIAANGKGTISGTLEGTWDPRTGDFDALVVVEQGTGRHAGLTGSGTFEGSGSPGGGEAQPPSQLSLRAHLAVERTTI